MIGKILLRGRRRKLREILHFLSLFKPTQNFFLYKYENLINYKFDSLFSPTKHAVTERLSSLLTKYEIKWTSKFPISLLFRE